MRLLIASLLLFAAHLCPGGAGADVITSCAELRAFCGNPANAGRTFDITGNLCTYYRRPTTREWIFTVYDGSDCLTIFEYNGTDHPAVNLEQPQLNDRIRLKGVLYLYQGLSYPGYTTVELVTHEPPSADTLSRPRDLFNPLLENRILQLRGTVRDFFRDEGSSGYIYMALNCNGEIAHTMIHHPANEPVDASRYIGADVRVFGASANTKGALRQLTGRFLMISGLENVHIVKSNPADSRSSLKDIDDLDSSITDIASLGRLHKVEGTVLATWSHNEAILLSRARKIVKVKFLDNNPPRIGQGVRAAGIPETDLYFINLANATWEEIPVVSHSSDPTRDISTRELFIDKTGFPQLQIKKHGQILRLTGIVRHLPQPQNADSRFHIESEGHFIPIDISENISVLKKLELGSRVSVSGICVMDIDSYGIGTSIPQARGFFLVLRTPDDLVVLSRPPWWTPFRLMLVIGALVLALAGILIWNATLRRLAERRGKELAEEQVNRAISDLKVYERTHLAVELHDSLSQTLSGVSMQIDAVGRFADTDRERMRKHLGIASKTLKSCRDELRNCLTDLRSNALEERDMNEAIRQTLEPYSDDAAISIRFFIPREILSDNTAHTILRIIRELVVNAIRHGHADKVKVAGALEDGKLLFSITDNGCGFDTESVPGLADGHFGLQGIRERVDGLDGSFEIESKTGHGSKATVSIHLPEELNEEKS